MPRTCTICTHEQRKEINGALLQGEPLRQIAARYGTSTGTLQRHREHIPDELVKARDAGEIVQASSLLDRLREINRETREVLEDARVEGNGVLRLHAITRLEKQLELEAKLLGELQPEGTTVNIYAAPEWLTLRAVVLQALQPYPEAAQAVGRAITDPDRRHRQ